MPAYKKKITRGPNKGKYTVRDPSGKVHAKATTEKKAAAQVRVLNSRGRK